MEEVREYERTMQEKTNCKVKSSQNAGEAANNEKKTNPLVLIIHAIQKSHIFMCAPTTAPILK